MNYERIVNQSLKIAFKKPSLWVLGMLAGGGGFNIYYRKEFDLSILSITDLQSFIDFYRPIMIPLMIMSVLSILATAFAIGGLIEAVNHLVRGGDYRFADCLTRAAESFWKMLGLSILEIGMAFIGLMIIVTFGSMFSWATLFLTVPAFVVYIFCLIFVVMLARRSVVMRDTALPDGIEEGIYILRSHWRTCLEMAAVAIGITLAAGLVTVVVGLVLFMPLNSFLDLTITSDISLVVAAFVLGLPVSVVVGGIIGTAITSLSTLFYLALVEPDVEHRVDELYRPV